MKILSLENTIAQSCEAKLSLIDDKKKIFNIIDNIFVKLKKGGKILLCGNGVSASDAQHLAAEFLIRLNPDVNRNPIPAITLNTDTSTITACGNDYKFEDIFLRPFLALVKKNDVLLTISTSGKSKNIIKVLKKAKQKKIYTVGFLGKDGGAAKKFCNDSIIIKSNSVARIQEAHIFLGHFIFDNIEKKLLTKQ